METYFHKDPIIGKWIDQIIGKIFTICILTGVDSDEEFQKGCQIVTKLTSLLLQDIPTIPSEYLADGVKQLIEQQLPDARVVNNFPAFQTIMDRMLNEGISKATGTLPKEAYNSISSTVNTKGINIDPHDSYTDNLMEVSCIENDTDSVRPDLATLDIPHSEIQHTKEETQARANDQVLESALAQAEIQAKADAQTLAEALAQAEIQAKADVQTLAEALAQAEIQAKADAQTLAEALAQAETQAKADAQTLAEALAQAQIQATADAQTLAEALAQAQIQATADAQTLAQAETQAKADAQALTNALAQVNSLTKAGTQADADAVAFADELAQLDTKLEAITKIERHELAKPMSSTCNYLIENVPNENDTNKNGTELEQVTLIKVSALFTSINSKILQVFNFRVPQQADLLRKVLRNFFPKSTVYWNKILMGQTFLAQVEDILICIHDPERPCNLKKLNKDGWKVLVCSNEDLTFPRRLEREIKQIQRSGMMSGTV